MKNEEKARKLAIQSTRDVDCNGNETYNAFVEAALLEMAQWKDEQLSKCLENLEKEYIRNSGKGLYDNEELAAKLATLKRIEEEMK